MRITPKFWLLLLTIVATQTFAEEELPLEIVGYLEKQGSVINSQIFSAVKPKEQIVLYYCVDENQRGGVNEGANNPANVHCEVALFNRNTKWIFANQISIGQGTIFEFTDGVVLGEATSYTQEDALCCPSKTTEIELTTMSGKLAKPHSN